MPGAYTYTPHVNAQAGPSSSPAHTYNQPGSSTTTVSSSPDRPDIQSHTELDEDHSTTAHDRTPEAASAPISTLAPIITTTGRPGTIQHDRSRATNTHTTPPDDDRGARGAVLGRHDRRRRRSVNGRAALEGIERFRNSWVCVLIIKVVVALAQVITLLVFLILASTLSSPLYPSLKQSGPSETCPKPRLFQAWMAIQMFRLGACLSLSMWVWRKKRLIENVVRRDRNADLEAGPVEARPTEADPHEGEANAQSGERQQSVASASADRATGQPQATQVERTEVSGVVSLKVASRLRKWINVLAFVLFILGNILVFKPLPSESGDPTCYNASPMLWWGVMSVTAVGWAFAAQVVFWALLGMLLGLTRMILRRMGILPPLPQPELARPSRPAPLSKTEVNKLGYVIYLPESAAPTSLPSELNPASPTASATDPTQHNQHDLLAQEKGLNVRHPIVRLEESQATCGICQEDYVAPERGAEGQLELLRQLGCGHVYHAKCIDQWLTKQAGNCPFCNRSVEIMIRQAKEKKREQEA